jgi:hypothetical protein
MQSGARRRIRCICGAEACGAIGMAELPFDIPVEVEAEVGIFG